MPRFITLIYSLSSPARNELFALDLGKDATKRLTIELHLVHHDFMEQIMAVKLNSPQKFIVKHLKMVPALKSSWLLFIGTFLY